MLTLQGANIGSERFASAEQYRWFHKNKAPLPGSHVWLCRYGGEGQWPLSAHQYGLTMGPAGVVPPEDKDPTNGFGVVFAVGPVAFWLFGHDLPGDPPTQAGSDDTHLLIWPAMGADCHWPPRQTLPTEAALEQLARRMPAGVQAKGWPLPGHARP